MHHQQVDRCYRDGNWCEVTHRVIWQVNAQKGLGPHRAAIEEDRVSIGRRICDKFGSLHTTISAAIQNDYRLAETRNQGRRNEPPESVESTAGFRGDNTYGLGWKSRLRSQRERRWHAKEEKR